jgi:hypothetical protein
VLKPSEVAPVNAFLLTEAIHAAGLPRGVFNRVNAYGSITASKLPDMGSSNGFETALYRFCNGWILGTHSGCKDGPR